VAGIVESIREAKEIVDAMKPASALETIDYGTKTTSFVHDEPVGLHKSVTGCYTFCY
jgi:hypothetical protein